MVEVLLEEEGDVLCELLDADGLVLCSVELLEGDVLCELEADGFDWSDCGSAEELDELLDELLLVDGVVD